MKKNKNIIKRISKLNLKMSDSEENIEKTIFDIVLEDDPFPKIKQYIIQDPSKIFTELENDNFTSK